MGIPLFPNFSEAANPDLYQDGLEIRVELAELRQQLDLISGKTGIPQQYQSQLSAGQAINIQNLSRVFCIVSEDVAPGMLVNLFSSGGELRAQKADSGTPKYARGFCTSNELVTTGNIGEFKLIGVNRISGLTPGATYYLSGMPGYITTAPGTQQIGFALSENELWFYPQVL